MTFTAGNKDIGALFKVGAKLAEELVGQALDAGDTFFDTADGYAGGESETLLGQALAGRRDEVVIATKVGFRTGAPLTQAGLSRRHILWSADQRLKRLGTDWIDVYAPSCTWLRAKPSVTSVILGAAKLNQLEDNLGAVGVKLACAGRQDRGFRYM